jgi:type IV pilus assembly protein PilA
MLRRREGFTLIELLIVVVIIGILAAIAIPKFAKTREKAYFSAVKSDLKNLQASEEIYYSNPQNNYTYANAVTSLADFTQSQGVSIGLASATSQGWAATGTHAALSAPASQFCGVYVGNASAPGGLGLSTPGIVLCTGEP